MHCAFRIGLNRPDDTGDFGGGASSTFGEFSDFVCHDRKTTALLSGTSGFDCRIQGEKIGLVGEEKATAK